MVSRSRALRRRGRYRRSSDTLRRRRFSQPPRRLHRSHGAGRARPSLPAGHRRRHGGRAERIPPPRFNLEIHPQILPRTHFVRPVAACPQRHRRCPADPPQRARGHPLFLDEAGALAHRKICESGGEFFCPSDQRCAHPKCGCYLGRGFASKWKLAAGRFPIGKKGLKGKRAKTNAPSHNGTQC